MSTRVFCFVVAAALAVAARGVVFAAQTTTVPASPSVELTIATIEGRLGLLVFWRGKPGWTQTTAGLPASLQGAGRPAFNSSGRDWRDGALNVSLLRGPFVLRLSYNVLRQRIDLGNQWLNVPHGTNVVLLDEVDQPRGPRVVGVLSMDPGTLNLDPRRGSIGPLLGRIPQMKTFLQCDALPPERQFAPDTSASVRESLVRKMRGYCDDIK